MPGEMVVLQRDDGQVPLTRRGDDCSWCLPAGAAEVGGSFARTAIDVRKWKSEPRPDGDEATQIMLASVDGLPDPLHAPAAHALELLRAYFETGAFQLR